jgi:hypothetical protein
MYTAGVVAGQKHNSRSDFGQCAPRELGVGAFSERTCQEPMNHTVIRSGIISDAPSGRASSTRVGTRGPVSMSSGCVGNGSTTRTWARPFDHYFDAVPSRSSMTKRMSVTASSPAGTQIACNPHARVVNAPAIAPTANAPITRA